MPDHDSFNIAVASSIPAILSRASLYRFRRTVVSQRLAASTLRSGRPYVSTIIGRYEGFPCFRPPLEDAWRASHLLSLPLYIDASADAVMLPAF